MRLRWWIVAGLLVALALAAWLLRAGGGVEKGSWLVVELEGEYVEADVSPLQRLTGNRAHNVAALLSQLGVAERDGRIAGVLFEVRGLDVGWAKASELRRAIARLRDKGKRTVAYLEVEKYGANVEYYVASAAETVYAAPGTRNPFLGFASEPLFLGGLLEKLGIVLEYERVGKYKTAVDTLAGKEMSDANREMSEALLDSISGRFLDDVAASRKIPRAELEAIVDRAPASPPELEQSKLIDGAAFVDEIVEKEGHPKLVKLADYAHVDPSSVGFSPKATFALIYGAGSVTLGEGGGRPGGGPVMASAALEDAFEAAAESSDVRAIVFRIDSPGGSALASDVIWRALRKARAKGKPVVASLSDVAASGGYYVAAGADKIVAEPSTITGSIGVFVIRPMLAGAFEKLGIGTAALTRGRHADLLLSAKPLSDSTREVVRREVQGVYRQFVDRVADGRKLDAQKVDEIGRGRVWTGAQAKEIGLVDELGGLREAVLEAKKLVDLAPDTDVALVQFPAPKPLAVQIRDALSGGGAAAQARAQAEDLVLGTLPRGARLAVRTLESLPTGVPVLIPPVFAEVR